MKTFFVIYGIAICILIAMAMIRVIKGPGVYNRVGAISAIGNKSIILVLLMGMAYGQLDMVIDISLAYSMLNFVGTVAAAKYLGTEGGQD